MLEMSEDSLSPQQNLKPALDAALERAIKAEKAYLSLKWDSYIEKMRNATTSAEQEYAAKISLYSSLPDQQIRLKDEFQKRTHEINMRIDSAKEIHAMCIEALEKGLCMDDLPLNSTDSGEVRAIIQKLLTDRQFRNNGTEQLDAYETMAAHLDSAVIPNGYLNYAQRQQRTANNVRPIGSIPSVNRGVIGNGSSSSTLAMHQRQAVTTASFAAIQLPQQVHATTQPLANSLQYYANAEQLQRYGGTGQPSSTTQRALAPNQVYYNHQQLGSYPNARITSPITKASAVAPQQLTNNLGGVTRYGTNQLTTPFSATSSPTNASSRMQAVGQPAATSAVNDLDNFVIEDDDMFSSAVKPLPDANIHNGDEPKPLVTTNKLIDTSPPEMRAKPSGDTGAANGSAANDSAANIAAAKVVGGNTAGAKTSGSKTKVAPSTVISGRNAMGGLDTIDSIDDGNSDEGSARTDHSISDDEEFATRLATRQGAASRSAAPVAATKPKEGSKEAPKETVAGKADPADDDVDWSKEPWLSVVQNMIARYKLNKKAATQFLQAALNKVGGITELDAVWAEAERSMQSALKPNPLEQKAKTAASNSQSAVNKTSSSSATAVNARKVETTTSKGGTSNYKTVMCDNWQRNRTCPRGEYCTFAHGKGDIRPRQPTQQAAVASASTTKPASTAPSSYYKVILCRNFEAGGCDWGSECIFAHGKEELRRTHSDESPRENTVEASSASEPHPEPCNGQQCPLKLEYLLRKTGFCEKNKQGLCKYGKECKFAHSRKELKPMPKWEMCQRHQARKCMHSRNPEKCVYAHSKDELRKKPADLETSQKPPAQATGGRLIPPGSRYVPWAGQDKHPTTPKDGDECLICMGPLLAADKKNLLKCGHNSFHERCISQWVNEGMPSCPVCREPAKLPDMFKAPAGFQPEEFPGLGL